MLLDIIRQAVRDEIDMSDVGLGAGCVLSGGIDSSTITTLAREHTGEIEVFTGYYDGAAYDERPYARLVAGSLWHEIRITPDDFTEHIDACIAALNGRRVGPGAFGQYMVARYAAEHVDCVLSGEGGDELFGGYARLAIVAGARVPDGYDDYRPPADYPDTVEAALRYDLAGLPALLEVDQLMCAPFGLTSKAPMTDIRVVAYTLSRPPEERIGKTMLRQAVSGFLPDEIVGRTDKRGFPVPFVEWANGPLRDFVHDRIGYTPDITQPWDRRWWYDLCAAAKVSA